MTWVENGCFEKDCIYGSLCCSVGKIGQMMDGKIGQTL